MNVGEYKRTIKIEYEHFEPGTVVTPTCRPHALRADQGYEVEEMTPPRRAGDPAECKIGGNLYYTDTLTEVTDRQHAATAKRVTATNLQEVTATNLQEKFLQKPKQFDPGTAVMAVDSRSTLQPGIVYIIHHVIPPAACTVIGEDGLYLTEYLREVV